MVTAMALAAMAAGCVAHETDEADFRAKVVAGCQTDEECGRLKREALARYVACVKDDPYGCGPETRDSYAADRLVSRDRQDSHADKLSDDKADYAAAQATMARAHQLGDSCSDLAELEAIQPNPPWLLPAVADEYHAEAANRRRARVVYLMRSIEELTPVHIEEVASGRGRLPEATRLAEELRCYDSAAADKATADLDRYRACLTDDACAAGMQYGAALCALYAERDDAKQQRVSYAADVATERRNPGGANPYVLSDYGAGEQVAEQRARRADAAIKALEARYSAAAHRPFDKGDCR